jgi:hypothetical protein|tara:strand:- start:429 stop:599 length:171 start_codon:yes stop_codon:yes gene_type:complete
MSKSTNNEYLEVLQDIIIKRLDELEDTLIQEFIWLVRDEITKHEDCSVYAKRKGTE